MALLKYSIDCSNAARVLVAGQNELAPVQESIVRRDVAGPGLANARLLGRAECDLEGADDLQRDLVLHREDIGEVAIVALRP